MNQPFFVTGMIRSRSAWLSNVFTTDSTLCFHDPSETVEQLMNQYPHYRVGVSSSYLVTNFRQLTDKYPEAPWLYIDREEQEAKRSLMKFTDGKLFGKDVDRILKRHAVYAMMVKDHPKTLVVPFHEIDTRLCEAWQHLLKEPFQAVRAGILRELRVEQRLGVILNRLMKGNTCPVPG